MGCDDPQNLKPKTVPTPYWMRIDNIARCWARETSGDEILILDSLVRWYGEVKFELDPEDAPYGHADITRDLSEPFEAWEQSWMSREYFEIFCKHDGVIIPRFWSELGFPNPSGFGKGGRPNHKVANRRIFQERLNSGQINLHGSLKAAANVVLKAGSESETRTIEKHISELFRAAKKAARQTKR